MGPISREREEVDHGVPRRLRGRLGRARHGDAMTGLAEVVGPEEVAELTRGRSRRVRPVGGVALDAFGEELADGAFVGVGRIRRAHHFAPVSHGVLALKGQQDAGQSSG